MAASGDLINFDVIEGQKENIQSLPGGRSAKKLAALYSPTPLQNLSTPTPTDTKNVNDCIRAEYEAEIQNISESDDPLDVYDRYVRWTLDAYPSAQATPQSQLHTLLERATKAFISSPQYKNDPRYLKLWLHYIQFFTDAPRETYVYLARHGVGDTLALFYEEYGAWLESAGRWAQAEEVYKLGIEREARPVQRLLRKFKEFEERQSQNPNAGDAPSSPALPTVRPALVSKMDPFGASSRPADPQAPAQSNGIGSAAGKPAKSKLTIFSDADAKPPALSSAGEGSKGWATIGSLAERKKENVMEPKPWVGETLKAGGKKPAAAAAKMSVFRDPSLSQIKNIVVVPSKNQVTVHPQTGKKEYIFVDLAAVYPTPDEPGTELSFEEIAAANRGWLDCAWEEETIDESRVPQTAVPLHEIEEISKLAIHQDVTMYDENGAAVENHPVAKTAKKKKVMEVNETQIIKAKLNSPSGPKMRKKHSSEPTMTIHTRAATDDIYDIFNAPLKSTSQDDNESDDEYDYETDGDYTTDAESTTGATKNVEPSEHDDETSDAKSLSEWSEFSNGRHVPPLDGHENSANAADNTATSVHFAEPEQYEHTREDIAPEDEEELHTPVMQQESPPRTRTVFVPIPPEDYDAPTRPYRDPVEVANNRLPFMTPITERTEVSLDMDENYGYEDRVEQYKTPCRRDDQYAAARNHADFEPLSSPLRDIVEDDFPAPKIPDSLQSRPGPLAPKPAKAIPKKGPIIKDIMCNPMDDMVRKEILANIQPPLSSYKGFHDHRNEQYEKSGQIRKFIKALSVKSGKNNGERTGSLPPQVFLEFPGVESTYTVKKELGAGAFAPVYLVENDSSEADTGDENSVAVMGKGSFAVNQRSDLEALKMEDPPSPWEFYMMRLAHSRLGPQHRVSASLSYAHELHLYGDEAYLFLPYHPYGTLLDVVNHFHAESSGAMDEQLAMFFAVELLRTVEGLHAKSFIHGDIKADNCLLRLDALPSGQQLSGKWRSDGAGGWSSRGISLIDFGRGIDMKAFVPNVEFFADWKTSEQDCAEMREARPWTWQIDYYGLAGTIHCLLFGKYIETARCDQGGIGKHRRYKIRECLKRYWQVDIWSECFEVLLNPGTFVEHEDGASMPVLKSMKRVRETMESWLEANSERGIGLKSLMSKLDVYAKNRK